jgi:PPOX class probable FMN-dependent enzyme
MIIVENLEQLAGLYGEKSEASLIKVTSSLTPEYQRMIEASPFMALATAGPEGLDCSPRGDAGQVIHIENPETLLLPDWRGNNRIDSLSNIVRDPRVALMFLIPGSNIAMRVNGRAVLRIDEEITHRFTMDGKHPRSVIVVTIMEVYSQCARALMRADLWNPEQHRDPSSLPSVGQMLKGIKSTFDQETYDCEWAGRAAKTMW